MTNQIAAQMFITFVALMIIGLSGCGWLASLLGGSSTSSNTTATLSSIQANVFNTSCTSCHSGSSPAGSLNLTSGQSYGEMVSVNATTALTSMYLVKPGSSTESVLIRRLEGNGVGPMPQGGSALDAAVINTIKAWIDAGAANN